MAQQNQRARQQQRQRFIIILVLILLLGAGAFYFFVSKEEDLGQVADTSRPLGQVAVPVIAKEIPLGSRIARGMFTVKFMAPKDVPQDAILNVDEFIGRFVTHPLLVGNYIRTSDVSAPGAVGGYSALARSGKRLIVLDAKMFPGSISTLRVGDRVDLLAIGSGSSNITSANAAPAGRSLADSGVTMQGGGAQPGDPNSQAKQNARARAAAGSTASTLATTATLVAENAEVLRTPSKGVDTEYLVLQMTPQDAHVTTLMAASNMMMRVVFRPFDDETRLTQDVEAKVTTRLPRPVADPDAITIISGDIRRMQRPNSKLFSPDNQVGIQNNQNANPGNLLYSDVRSRNGNVSYDSQTNNNQQNNN